MEVKNNMVLDSKLIKEFAQLTDDSEVKNQTTHLRGTIVSNSGGKYVQLDGSSTITPISEIVDVEEGDRVLVSIENHKATIIGNFTFPPSARKEQEALDQAGAAQESANNASSTANKAQEKAQEASSKADTAISQSSIASASADEAKQQANDAIATANTASTNASEAKTLATQASTEATEAKQQAAASQASSADAQAQVAELQNEVKVAQEDADKALTDLATQASEIASVKENYATKVEVGNTKAELETSITKKVGELETIVSETYSTKTENVELEGRLQSQITQNAEGLASQVSKTEKLESDTAQAQEDVTEALRQAAAAQSAADNAQSIANSAQTAATAAQSAADTAAAKANTAQNAADLAQDAANAADEAVQAAQSDLNEAKENLASVTSRVDATETEIAEAQAKVDAAQTSVNNALADAAEANLAAAKAQEAADKAQQDAETAQGAANTAQQKADNAQTAANNAQAAADKAQADVAALTSRVTSAETTISQNSENITLNANKITEIGNQADATDENLANNYYNKTETDAMIKIESDRITSTVTKVETVEKTAVTSSVEQFYLSESPTSLSGGSWETTQPTWTEGKYIWRRTLITKGDGTTSYQPNQNGVCITGNTGAAGATGSDGKGIKSITRYYLATSQGPASGFEWIAWDGDITGREAIENMLGESGLNAYKMFDDPIPANEFVIPGVEITYADGDSEIAEIDEIQPLSDDGKVYAAVTGMLPAVIVITESTTDYPQSPGVYLLNWTNMMYVSQIVMPAKSVTTDTDGWTTSIQTTDTTNKYLWSYEVITYTDDSVYTSTPVIIGTHGETGATGSDGKGVAGTDITYQGGTSGTTIPTGTWTDTIPTVAAGSYLWTRTITTYTDNTTSTAYSVGKMGDTGAAGATGADGRGIADVVTTYQASNSGTIIPTGTWSTEVPTTTAENPYLWTRTITTYTDNTTSTAYAIGATPEGVLEEMDEVVSNVENTMDSRLDEVNTSIQTAQSTINQLSNMISHLVTDSNGESLMTQTSDGWTFNMSSISGNLDAIKNAMSDMDADNAETNNALQKLTDLVNSVAQKTAYITLSTVDEPYSITWDGDADNKDMFTDSYLDKDGNDNGTQVLYKVSDLVLEKEVFIGGTLTMYSGSAYVTQNLTEDDIIEIDRFGEGNAYALWWNELVFVIRNQCTINDYECSPGTYFMKGGSTYISEVTYSISAPCIELGKTDSLFKVRITNTAIDFLEGSTKIAYANNNTFYSDKIITKELQIGEGPGFVWQTRENGNLGLVYISN